MDKWKVGMEVVVCGSETYRTDCITKVGRKYVVVQNSNTKFDERGFEVCDYGYKRQIYTLEEHAAYLRIESAIKRIRTRFEQFNYSFEVRVGLTQDNCNLLEIAAKTLELVVLR